LLPVYYLLRDRERVVLALSEWEDFAPPDRLVAKPILRAPVREGERLVAVDSLTMGDLRRLRWRSRLRETELSQAAAEGRDLDPLTRHLPLNRWAVERTFHLPAAAHMETPELTQTRETLAAFNSPWSALLGEAVAGSYIFGSAVYAPDARRDLDLVVPCTPARAHALRDAVAQARAASGRPDRRGFAFRCRIGGEVVDFFPALAPGQPHPLADPVAWRIAGEPHLRTVEVVDTELDCYAWPTLAVEPAPRLLLICSNAYRGCFLVGDRLQLRAIRVDVELAKRSLTIDVVGDPWRDIGRASELFVRDRAPLR
jgi:hypothetical protein